MCMHLWINLIKRTIDIQEKFKKIMKIYVQSQWRVALLWYHIFWQSFWFWFGTAHNALVGYHGTVVKDICGSNN